MADNNFNSYNWHKQHCSTQILGDAYFVSISDVPTTLIGAAIPMPTFGPNAFKDVCVFNNTDKIVEISYSTEDNNVYTFRLAAGETYTHTSDTFIVNNSFTVKSLNGTVTSGVLDIYFNYGLVTTTTTSSTNTSTSSTSSTSTSSTSTSTTTSTTTTTVQAFPGSFVTVAGWDFSAPNQRAIVYLPYGYNPNSSKTYPWAIHLHSELDYGTGIGAGGIDRLYRSGPAKYIKLGDSPTDYIIICPQITSGEWTPAKIDFARTWAISNYKVDSTKLTLSGSSIGTTGIGNYIKLYPNKLASYVTTSGTLAGLGDPSTIISGIRLADIPGYYLVGNQDSQVDYNGPISFFNTINDLDPKPVYPFLLEFIHGGTHSRTVWDDGVYNRKYRTDVGGTASLDWIEDIAKQYRTNDHVYNATKKVELAETDIDLNQYLEALRVVNKLTASGSKSQLRSRLAVVANNIRAYHRNFIISFGSVPATNGVYNNIPVPSFNSSPALKDISGFTAPITFSIPALNWTTSTSVDVKLGNDYLGFDSSFHETAFRCYGSNNVFRLSNLKSNKLYNIRVFFADNNFNENEKTGGLVQISGTTKQTNDPSFNGHRYLEFTNVNTSSGILDINISAYNSFTFLDITGLTITELITSTGPILGSSTSTTTTTSISDFDFNVTPGNIGGNFEFYLTIENP